MSFTTALFDLTVPVDRLIELAPLLDESEQERAAAFHFQRDRDRFIARRGLLRIELARAIGQTPETLRYDLGPQGKPRLRNASELRFNLSFSNDLALFAMSRSNEIGCDIERINPAHARRDVAQRFFSPEEFTVLTELPEDQWAEGFFNCWTRKEAYLKAVGEGLAAPLDSFDVTLAPDDPPRMLTLKGDADRAARWFFRHFRPAEDYIGALAIEGGTWEVKTWALTP